MFSQHILTIALKTIQYSIDPFIMVLGVFCVIRMLMKYQALNNLHHEVERELGGYVPSDVKVADKTLSADYQLKINLLKERQLKELFDKESAQYIVLSQLTGIFPLLGILGTVAGLMLNVSAENAEQMMSSLNTALSSTLWGLFFAILLRTLDSYKLAPVVYLIESRFSDYETLYHNIQMEQASREFMNSGKNSTRYNKQPAKDGRSAAGRKEDHVSGNSESGKAAQDKNMALKTEKPDVEKEMFAEYDRLTGSGMKKEGTDAWKKKEGTGNGGTGGRNRSGRRYNSENRTDRKYSDKQENNHQ